MGDITYNGVTIDPSPGGEYESRDAENTNYIYVQGKADLNRDQKDELEALKVQFQEYIGNNAYLCRYEETDLAPLRGKDYVRAANVFHKVFKLSPDLTQAQDPVEVDISLHKQANTAAAVAPYLDEVGVPSSEATVTYRNIRVRVPPEALTQIQGWESVNSITRVLPNVIFNNLAREDMHDDTVTAFDGGSNAGQGQIVSVNDSGFDLGAREGEVLPDDIPEAFEGRLKAVIAGSRNTPGATFSNDPSGHGTHVCGSVAGNGTSTKLGGSIQGTAPAAGLVLTSWQYPDPAFPRNLAIPSDAYNMMFKPPFANGPNKAYISTNSFGKGPFGTDPPAAVRYALGPAGQIDGFVWDNPQCLILFAAGNDGDKPDSPPTQIGDWAGAKNCITVGATVGSRPRGNNKLDPGESRLEDRQAVTDFSSRGPTPERRIKPDITAPGSYILSAASRDRTAMAAVGTSQRTSDPAWILMSGTSMATPLVAGCCAVLRQAVIASGTPAPSAALIKALLINGALASGETERSALHAKSAPDGESGFGFVNIANANAQISARLFKDDVAGLDDRSRTEVQYSITLPHGQTGLKVTMAYSDRAKPRLQNKLILSIVQADSSRIFDTGQTGHATNNVQQIIVHHLSRDVKISVQCARITTSGDRQPFAVAWQYI